MKTCRALMAASLCLLFGQVVVAQDRCGTPDCCARCNVRTRCQQFDCQVVCEVKKVKKSCWVVECEEFAPLLPGCRQRCNDCCNTGGCNTGGCETASCGSRGKCEVPPRCGKARVKRKLVKKEITVEVPVYKTVVRNLCSGCCPSGCGVEAGDAAAPSAAPAAPAPAPVPKAARQTLLVPMPSY